ncbi:MAG: hypothetical protein R8P61_33090 [Bacteroidia bacterium]|nr:hypothetical protein [Bacteroidia bacterium]
MKSYLLYLAALSGLLSLSLSTSAQIGNLEKERQNRLSIGWNFSHLSTWEMSSPYHLSFSYERYLKNSRWTIRSGVDIVSLCSQCDEEIDFGGSGGLQASIFKPVNVDYRIYSLLVGRKFKQREEQRSFGALFLGPALRTGYENYFLGVNGFEIFYDGRRVRDWGALIRYSHDIYINDLLNLQLSGSYGLFLLNLASNRSEFKSPIDHLSVGCSLIFKI